MHYCLMIEEGSSLDVFHFEGQLWKVVNDGWKNFHVVLIHCFAENLEQILSIEIK